MENKINYIGDRKEASMTLTTDVKEVIRVHKEYFNLTFAQKLITLKSLESWIASQLKELEEKQKG